MTGPTLPPNPNPQPHVPQGPQTQGPAQPNVLCPRCGAENFYGVTRCSNCNLPAITAWQPVVAPQAQADLPASAPSEQTPGARKMVLGDSIVAVSGITLLIAMALPWYTAGFDFSYSSPFFGVEAKGTVMTLSGYDAGGYRWLLVLTAVAVLAVLGLRLGGLNFKLAIPDWQMWLGAGGLLALLVFMSFVFRPGGASAEADDVVKVGYSYGIIISALAAIGVVVGALVRKTEPD